MIEKILIALAPAIAGVIEVALNQTYDQDAETQAILKLQRSAADLRVQIALERAASGA